MKEWLQLFKKNDSIILTIKGEKFSKTFSRKDCIKLGNGHEKCVYQIKGQNQCFFIPNGLCEEKDWNQTIEDEKDLLDQITNLGLKAQQFEIVSVEIQGPDPDAPLYSIKALLTKDFNSLCAEESIVIYNKKGMPKNQKKGTPGNQVIGECPDFIAMREKLKEPNFVRGMFKKIINEYSMSLAFSLPISMIGKSPDDSCHYCFELAKNPDEPPVLRYMFWDVVSDFTGVNTPIVPTRNDLKSGIICSPNKDIKGLDYLADQIAFCVFNINNDKEDFLMSEDDFIPDFKKDIISAINDNEFIDQALNHTREKASDYLSNLFASKPEMNDHSFTTYMQSAISTSNLDLVKTCLQLYPDHKNLPKQNIDSIVEYSKKYPNEFITRYLEEENLIPKAENTKHLDNKSISIPDNENHLPIPKMDKNEALIAALKSKLQELRGKCNVARQILTFLNPCNVSNKINAISLLLEKLENRQTLQSLKPFVHVLLDGKTGEIINNNDEKLYQKLKNIAKEQINKIDTMSCFKIKF